MLIQILSHTPAYVWAILAFLMYRGTVALREREVAPRQLTVIPIVILLLSIQDIVAKFGLGLLPLLTWVLGAAGAALLAWKCGATRIVVSAASVRIKGSPAPLAMMLGVFAIKYAASVAWAVAPLLHHDALFATALCVLFGILSGCFLGAMVRDLGAYRRAASQVSASLPAALPPAKQAVSR